MAAVGYLMTWGVREERNGLVKIRKKGERSILFGCQILIRCEHKKVKRVVLCPLFVKFKLPPLDFSTFQGPASSGNWQKIMKKSGTSCLDGKALHSQNAMK